MKNYKKQPQSRNDLQQSGLRMLTMSFFIFRIRRRLAVVVVTHDEWSARLIAWYRYIGNGLVWQFNTTSGADKVVSRREKSGFSHTQSRTPCARVSWIDLALFSLERVSSIKKAERARKVFELNDSYFIHIESGCATEGLPHRQF